MGKIIHELKKVSGRLLFPLLIPSKKTSSDKILLLKNDSIGDFLLFSGILNFYTNRFGDRVYCLVNNVLAEVAKLYTDNVIVIDNDKYFTSLNYRYNFLKQLNAIGFGMAINSILNSSESRDILSILKIPATYLYEGSLKKQRQWKNVANIIPSIKPFDDSGMYVKVLNHEKHYMERVLNAKVFEDEINPYIPLNNTLTEITINKFNLEKGRYIAFSSASGSFKKNYPFYEFIEVVTSLYKKFNISAVIIGQDKQNTNTLPDFILDLRGKTSLIEAFSIIKHSRLFIGNDTGITHASWIMGVPTVMIQGGGHFGRFHPIYKNGHIINKYMDCYYCNWECKYNDTPVPCIKDISASDIIRLSEEILS